MKLKIARIDFFIGYEVAAALTAVLLLDREYRILCCFLAAAVHELGHVLMMLLYRVRVRRVRLRLFDTLIEADDAPSASADVWITLGGPLANLLFAAVLCPFGIRPGLPHLALGIFNLLPVMSLDGGHLLSIFLIRKYTPRVCDTVIKVTTFIILLPLMTAGLFVLFNSGYNYSLLISSLYLTAILFIKK